MLRFSFSLKRFMTERMYRGALLASISFVFFAKIVTNQKSLANNSLLKINKPKVRSKLKK